MDSKIGRRYPKNLLQQRRAGIRVSRRRIEIRKDQTGEVDRVHEVLKYMKDRTPEMLQMLQALVEIESPSTNKSATDKIAENLRDTFAALGAKAELIPVEKYGNHVRVEWGTGADQVLVLCHMDTVWDVGEIKKRPFKIEGDRAMGPGIEDMKEGIVHVYFALKAIQELGLKTKNRVVLLMNTDEELGSPTSRPLIEAEAKKSKCALVLEPSEHGCIKTFRKGVGMFEVSVTGKAAHAGADPENGISAVEEMSHQVLKLHGMTNLKTGTTVNVGVFNGGTRRNVIAAEAHAMVDLRVAQASDVDRVVGEILSLKPVLKGTTVKVTGGLNRPPMERTPEIVALFEKARELAGELGFEVKELGTGGGSDGNFTAAVGCPTLDGLGAVGEGGHALHEYIEIPRMPERAALLARLIETL
jgi:glutamate carboxypeptidase